jgi:hypothetical protein
MPTFFIILLRSFITDTLRGWRTIPARRPEIFEKKKFVTASCESHQALAGHDTSQGGMKVLQD